MLPESFISLGSEEGMTAREPKLQRYFKGQMNDVAIYSRALSADEIKADYEAAKPNE
jgi:hypothetical protein